MSPEANMPKCEKLTGKVKIPSSWVALAHAIRDAEDLDSIERPAIALAELVLEASSTGGRP